MSGEPTEATRTAGKATNTDHHGKLYFHAEGDHGYFHPTQHGPHPEAEKLRPWSHWELWNWAKFHTKRSGKKLPVLVTVDGKKPCSSEETERLLKEGASFRGLCFYLPKILNVLEGKAKKAIVEDGVNKLATVIAFSNTEWVVNTPSVWYHIQQINPRISETDAKKAAKVLAVLDERYKARMEEGGAKEPNGGANPHYATNSASEDRQAAPDLLKEAYADRRPLVTPVPDWPYR